MVRSRLRNYQDKKERKQIMLILGSMVAIFLFLAIFGVKILVAFSLGVDKLRGSNPKDQQTTQTIIIPPILDPLPEATNTAEIKISGKAKGDVSILLYVNEKQTDKVKLQSDGTFQFSNVTVKEGTNVISAKATDDKNNSSELSEVLSILVMKNKPILDISSPSDNAEITGEKQMTTVTGKTGTDDTITINDRFVVVNSDGSFSYDLALKEGEQTIIITSKDQAGNETRIERKVTFKK